MGDESVIFEIQLERKILEQIFNENKNLKENYDKVIGNGEAVKSLKTEIVTLKNESENLRQVIKDFNEENNKLKTILQTEQTEKISITNEYENEKQILGEILRDRSKLQQTEEKLNEFTEKVKSLTKELESTKTLLAKLQTENYQLDIEKLDLRSEVKTLTTKLRLEEERNKSNDLAHVECKLLKLKLQTIEDEKKKLLDDFQKEIKIVTKRNKPRVAKLEENLRLLRTWVEKEASQRRPRETEEVKKLKAHIQSLENDKINLIEGFELERKVFQKILKSNNSYETLLP